MQTYLNCLEPELRQMLEEHPTSAVLRNYLRVALRIKEQLPLAESWEEWKEWLSSHPEPEPPHPLEGFDPLVLAKDETLELVYGEKRRVFGELNITQTKPCQLRKLMQNRQHEIHQIIRELLECTNVEEVERVERHCRQRMEMELTTELARAYLDSQALYKPWENRQLYYGQIEVRELELARRYVEDVEPIEKTVKEWLGEVIQAVKKRLEEHHAQQVV